MLVCSVQLGHVQHQRLTVMEQHVVHALCEARRMPPFFAPDWV